MAVRGPTDETATQAPGVRFSEVLTGAISRQQQSAEVRLEGNTPLALHLNVNVADLHLFLEDPAHTATLSGWLDCPALGGRLPVDWGMCSFFPRGKRGRGRRLCYRLTFKDGAGGAFTLRGVKHLNVGAPGRVWVDTTTLYVRVLAGHLHASESNGQESLAEGVVRIKPLAFARELTTFRADGRSADVRVRALLGYFAFFVGGLLKAYTSGN